ncbi:hypothetical protein FOA43_000815 [Brettanomyces nanus]|uniref:Uncharacterized protein n=1 Tax=Eeniella nana TaxID=13502 RepID=A0A875S2C4_EENNA|nr:uncharacterized protein FOA43_000815 [Brettanomyces nanus]QPG73504.1 hypothetical protein FOA43_000815 [Brettanomyces nanus]
MPRKGRKGRKGRHDTSMVKEEKEEVVKQEEENIDAESEDDADYNPKEIIKNGEEEVDSDTEVVYVVINQIRGRGRPRLKRKGEEELPKNKKIKKVFVDEDGNRLTIRDDEVVTPDDPKGDEKITEMGDLRGGRQFKVKTFTAIGRGDRKYMVSTDIARNVGYRDSYFLFQKHSHLFRVTINEVDKLTMIRAGILPSSFKTRAVYLVTARSIYKEFGAKVIINGRQVIDDYYEDKARKDGAIEGAPALSIIESTAHRSHHKKHEIVANQILPSQASDKLSVTWIYDNALKCRQFESMLLYDRLDLFNNIASGNTDRDSYTGITFVPNITQPTRHKIRKIVGSNEGENKLIFETKMVDSLRIKTGLSEVPTEIYEGVVDEDVRKAIEEQKKLELGD